ncbi:MAG: sulfate permease [Cyclobacteriaceae bacterium]|nr:sulfate permease [Cyclobacteriaceae bacterium]
MKKFLPILSWLPGYKKEYLSGDFSAGLTVGVMLIPQGMAYAMIAGLPPVYGLYAALVPQVVYAIFGTSRQLGVGPVAMDSLLVAAGVSVIAEAGSQNYISLAILLAFMMGVTQLALGLFRMGFLVNFLSKPVISGFTSAAALIIALNQLKHFVGVDLSGSNVFTILYEAILKFGEFNWISLVMGTVGVLILKNIKKLHKAIPGALVAVILGIIVVKIFNLNAHEVKIVGKVPEGLPHFSIPVFGSPHFNELIPIAATLALIAFMEAISVAKALQAKHKNEYKLDANQELIGLGMSNVVGSFFSCYPTTGGFSRSAVNEQSGAKTNLAALISASLVALTLLFLTPLFYYLPKSILAAIIMVAVFGLIDIKFPVTLWKTKKEDLLMLLIAFGVTLGFGIKEGIGVSVAISLLAMIYRSTKPHYAVLGKMPDSKEYRNIERFKDVVIRKDILIIRYDADLYFANTSHFMETLSEEVDKKGNDLKLVILHGGSIAHIDTTAYQALSEFIEHMAKNNVEVYLAYVIGPTRDFLRKAGLGNMLGEEKCFLDIDSAIKTYDEKFSNR